MTLTPEQILKIIKHLTSMEDFINNNPIDVTLEKTWDHFCHYRRFQYPPERELDEYKELEAKKEQLQNQLLVLVKMEKLQEAKDISMKISELDVELESCATAYLFERGILEGFILAFNLLGPRLVDMIKE